MAENKSNKTSTSSKSKKASIEEPTVKPASAEEITKNEELELSKTEREVLKIQEAAAQGEDPSGKKYKLADPNTSYQERGFTLVGDQEKTLPQNPSDQLIARIQSGFIVEA